MTKIYSKAIKTSQPIQMIRMGSIVSDIVQESSIQTGVVNIITLHTTTGITVNEGLDCLELDIVDLLKKLVPDESPYVHAHFLPSYGRTSANATSHLRGLLLGNNAIFPIQNGKVLFGGAQEIYLVELDGPQERKISIVVSGD